MEVRKERETKVGRGQMDRNLEMQTLLDFVVNTLSFCQINDNQKREKNPVLDSNLQFFSWEENLFTSLFFDLFVYVNNKILLWIQEKPFLQEFNVLSISWRECCASIRNTKITKQVSIPSRSLDFWAAFCTGPKERPLKSYVPPPYFSSHVHISKMMQSTRFPTRDHGPPSRDHPWLCDDWILGYNQQVPSQHTREWNSPAACFSGLLRVTSPHLGNSTPCNKTHGFVLIVTKHFPDIGQCPLLKIHQSLESGSLCKSSAILPKDSYFLISWSLTSYWAELWFLRNSPLYWLISRCHPRRWYRKETRKEWRTHSPVF